MQAVKVFNNNAVSVVMPDGREAILVGNGLGFGRRPGDVIDKSRVSKVYYVQNELQTKFLKMLDNVTPQVMQAAERISLAAEEQGILLSSKSTISLVDHISFALERVEKGTFLPNLMLSETRMLYPKEYAVGQRALELVRQFCGVQLPEDEAGYIALHLVAGAADGALAYDTVKFVKAVKEIICDTYHCTFEEESLETTRLTVGDATYTGSYIVMMMEYSMGLPFSDGIVWMYTGFTKTFGYFGIVAAFIFCARKENRKKTAAVLVPLAFTASLASITEPLDFMFCFTAPILWVAHACISGLFIVLLHIFHVTGFTTNLLGSVLMNLSAGADKTNYPTLYLLALCQIAVYFVVFTLLIKAFNLHTPGREEVSTETAGSDAPAKKASVKNAAEVQCVIDGLGGKENILSVDNCFTRLRVNIKDPAKLDEVAINKLPNSGIVKKGTDIQIVYGLQVADIKRAVEAQLENQ